MSWARLLNLLHRYGAELAERTEGEWTVCDVIFDCEEGSRHTAIAFQDRLDLVTHSMAANICRRLNLDLDNLLDNDEQFGTP